MRIGRTVRSPLILVFILAGFPAGTRLIHPKTVDRVQPALGAAVMWRDPVDIASRNLFYGPGGEKHQPMAPFTFEKEILKGSSPKFVVIDGTGTRWTVKMGIEVRPETAASRIVWAAGYFADEEYYLPELRVQNLPRLQRGASQVGADGSVYSVRLKRNPKEESDIGMWQWGACPFSGTAEWYGLRVLMALINNWDLKDTNNSVYEIEGDVPEVRYVVSDLGASFGPTSLSRSQKGELHAYRESKWIRSVSHDYVDFNVPSAPVGGYIFAVPIMFQRLPLVWVGHHIPRARARWIGELLARLSANQINDAFRAAGYSAREVEGFSGIVEHRIQELDNM